MLEVNQFVGFGAGGGGHLCWRFRNTSQFNDGGGVTNLQVVEMQMRAAGSAVDLCTGGTAIASSSYGVYTPDKAFDNNTADASAWVAVATGIGEWIGYRFAAPIDVAQIDVLIDNYGFSTVDVAVDYSDDGIQWTQAKQFSGLGAWPAAYRTLTL